MSNYRLRVLIALCSGLVACDEHTALNATAEVDLRPAAITPNTVVLVLAGEKIVWPDGQRVAPADAGTLLPADTRNVALKVCKGTPHPTVTRTLQTLQARKVSVTVSGADPAHCG